VILDPQPLLLRLLLESNVVRHADCRAVRMDPGSRLTLAESDPRSAHILLSGVTSHTVRMANGNRALMHTHSHGDLLELSQLLGIASGETQVCVTIPGEAVRIPFSLVQKTFSENRDFRDAVLVSAGIDCVKAQKLAACNLFHSLEERLARYLLMLQDQSGISSFPLTQEYMAGELGVQRSTVVFAAGELRKKGCVRFSRGHLQIADRARLEQATCECYAAMRPGSGSSRVTPLYSNTERDAAFSQAGSSVAA
jgi:CRP-like cAMP-binding protein